MVPIKTTGDVLSRVQAVLRSCGNSTTVSLYHHGIEAVLDGMNSPYVTHRHVSFGYDYRTLSDGALQGTYTQYGLFATNCVAHRLLLSAVEMFSQEEAQEILQPSSTEEVVMAIVPREWASDLLSRAREYVSFKVIEHHALFQVYCIRQKLSHYDEDGRPVFLESFTEEEVPA